MTDRELLAIMAAIIYPSAEYRRDGEGGSLRAYVRTAKSAVEEAQAILSLLTARPLSGGGSDGGLDLQGSGKS